MRKKIALLIAAIMMLSCITGCGKTTQPSPAKATQASPAQSAQVSSAQATQASSAKKVLNLGSTGYWCNEDMEPAASDTWNGWYIGYYGVSQQLFKLNNKFEPEPWLVKSYKQVDEKTWEFTLRDNVYFHNGPQMTAQSVKNCFERTRSVNKRATAADWIDSFEAKGQTLTIHTKRAVPTIANELSDPMWIVYYADEKVDYNDGKSYFTGPYVLKSFKASKETVVVKNEKYWGDKSKLDEVHFITVADDESAVMALEKGEIDMIYPVYSGAVGTLSNQKGIKIDGVTSSRGQFIEYNLKHPVTSDVNVRNAIAMCIDREGYAKNICNGTVTPSYGIFSDGLAFGGTDGLNLTVKKLDPDGAKALLAKSGYADSNGDGVLDKNGVPLVLKLIIRSKDTAMISMCDDLQSRLAGIGVKLEIVPLESTADTLASGNYDLACLSYAMAPTGTADYFINIKFISGSSQNYSGFLSQEVDALAKQIGTADKDATVKLARKIQQDVLDQGAYTFFAHTKYMVAYSDKVTGFVNNPTEYYCLDENMGTKD